MKKEDYIKKDEVVSCEKCKCLLSKTDAYKLNVTECHPPMSFAFSEGKRITEEIEYYCRVDKPESDFEVRCFGAVIGYRGYERMEKVPPRLPKE